MKAAPARPERLRIRRQHSHAVGRAPAVPEARPHPHRDGLAPGHPLTGPVDILTARCTCLSGSRLSRWRSRSRVPWARRAPRRSRRPMPTTAIQRWPRSSRRRWRATPAYAARCRKYRPRAPAFRRRGPSRIRWLPSPSTCGGPRPGSGRRRPACRSARHSPGSGRCRTEGTSPRPRPRVAGRPTGSGRPTWCGRSSWPTTTSPISMKRSESQERRNSSSSTTKRSPRRGTRRASGSSRPFSSSRRRSRAS